MDIAALAQKYPVLMIGGVGVLGYLLFKGAQAKGIDTSPATVDQSGGSTYVSPSQLSSAMDALRQQVNLEIDTRWANLNTLSGVEPTNPVVTAVQAPEVLPQDDPRIATQQGVDYDAARRQGVANLSRSMALSG